MDLSVTLVLMEYSLYSHIIICYISRFILLTETLLGRKVHTRNPSIWVTKAGGFQFKVSLGCVWRPCLKNKMKSTKETNQQKASCRDIVGSGEGCLTTSPINVSDACKNTCSDKVPPSEAERSAPTLVPYLL